MICSKYLLYILAEFAIPLLATTHLRETRAVDVLDWIDPLIGSRSGGNVFAGATLPYGMAKGLKCQRIL